MMHKYWFLRVFLLSLFIAGAGIAGFSQAGVVIPGDTTRFIKETGNLFVNLADKEVKEVTAVLTSLSASWNGPFFNNDDRKAITSIRGEMIRKKIRPYPDMLNYLRALDLFVTTNQSHANFLPWSESLVRLLREKNSRNFLALVEMSVLLFSEKTIYRTSTTQWKVTAKSFRFVIDSVPSVIFPASDLTCLSNRDSIVIFGTKGVYFPVSNHWIGEGGRADWRRAGEDPARVYVELSRYDILLRYSKYTADSVAFYHKKFFKAPLPGKFSDKIQTDVAEEKASYPAFTSYDKRIGIPGLFSNVDYLGGFAMEGSRIVGSGDRMSDAKLFFKKDGKDFVVAGSDMFVIRPNRINASNATVTIYHESDSIFHPGLQLKYLDEDKELSFTKDERVARISPWFDSYHKIEAYCEALYWKLGEPWVSFQKMKGPTKESKAVFESTNYFSAQRYTKIQGMDEINPLIQIIMFTQEQKTKEFLLEDLVNYIRIPSEQVEHTLLILSTYGYLVYDAGNKRVIIKDKMFDYVKAYQGKSDYDGIFFNSSVADGPNAMLNLETFDLIIRGVDMVVLSDTQQVRVYPAKKEVVLQKDMDFLSTGKVEAGFFDYYARDCAFNYTNFKLQMPTIDSMHFYVIGKKPDPKTGIPPLIRVKTAITNLSGELLIDDPRNKSGMKDFPQYPVFTNKNNAFVYWNKHSIQGGVYDKERFYYEVDPFTVSSLDDRATDSLTFTGHLASAGIFPDIREPLRVRPDNSLGIEKQTAGEGLPVYGGKGTYFNGIDLSESGLKGKGRLQCLNAESVSDDFLFLPDSMKAFVRSFRMAEIAGSPEFPSVTGDSVREFWLPGRDSLRISTTTRQMAMYGDQSNFSGTLSLTPVLLSGEGTIRIKDAEMDSKGFQFRRRTFDALIANFRIKSYDLADLTISTRNYQTHFDFDKRQGEFKSNIGISKVEFPINRYTCSMDRFDWLIDNEQIMLSNDRNKSASSDTLSLAQLIDLGYSGSEFVSTHPLQDSLKFFAAKARYHLRTNIINAEEVKIIKVADAAIYPDSGKVTIQKDARMDVLKNAVIIASTKNRYHQFYHAGVSVASRNNYSGNADYDYIDRTGEKQTIHFDRIRIDSAGSTLATGVITDSAKFMLSPEFAFKGDVKLNSNERLLTFDGGFHPVSPCFQETPQWVRFTSQLDPRHIMIPVNTPLRNLSRDNLLLGIMFINTENRVHPSFFRPRIANSDSMLISSEGYIEYNVPTSEFRIAQKDKLTNVTVPGSYLSLNNWNCKFRGEGKLNLSLKSEHLKLETFGTADHYVIPDSTLIHCALTMNFPFPEDVMQRFSEMLNAINLPGVKLFATPYAQALAGMLPPAESERLKTEAELLGRYKKFPEQLDRTFFLADVYLKWDSTSRSYIGNGNFGIASLGQNQVNRYVKGLIEFTRKRTGDEFTIYLELTKDDWFFFNYRNGLLQTLSSDLTYNDKLDAALQSGTEQKRLAKLSKGFGLTKSTDRKKREFLRKFEPAETE